MRCLTMSRLASAVLAPYAGAAAVLFALFPPRIASAYCRTTTVATVADFEPTPDQCWTQGFPLFWRNSCVGYSIQRGVSRKVSYDDAAEGASRAFTKWTGASCPTEGAGRSRVSIDIRDLGAVECATIGYQASEQNQNIIVFRDDRWPHDGSGSTIALTTVSFAPDTGEIFDADMEINTYQMQITLGTPVPPDGYDYYSVMTHEAGHFLGIAHSGDRRATMYFQYDKGKSAMRNLTSDDVAGICEIYRPDGSRAVLDKKIAAGDQCDPTPRRGFKRDCVPVLKEGCSGASSSIAGHVAFADAVTPPGGVSVCLGLGVAAMAMAMARRRARR